jgi:hypothetical protein
LETQSNPDWEAQDSSVRPIQNLSWRDPTLRRSRDRLAIRADAITDRRDRAGLVGVPDLLMAMQSWELVT